MPSLNNKKIHILNTVIKPNIAYAYYLVPFSKPDVLKLDKLLGKLTKEVCNIHKSTTNILTHLSIQDFGMYTLSFLLDYIHCIGKQILFALNNLGQLGLIY